MGIEIDANYGGAGSTFFSSIIAIEELAKVDPSVSVMCDVQNTLIIEYFRTYGSEELKKKYFPQLATDTVSELVKNPICYVSSTSLFVRLEATVSLNPAVVLMHLR